MPFKFIPEIATADIAFEASASSESELFQEAALAVEETMINTKSVQPRIKRHVSFEAGSLEDLLYDFLQELVFLKDSDGLFFSRISVSIERNATYKLKAELAGEQLDPARHELRDDVKAVTLHQFQIKKNHNWWCRVVLDI